MFSILGRVVSLEVEVSSLKWVDLVLISNHLFDMLLLLVFNMLEGLRIFTVVFESSINEFKVLFLLGHFLVPDDFGHVTYHLLKVFVV